MNYETRMIEVAKVSPGDNTRTGSEMGDIAGLQQSIRAKGIISPLHVHEDGAGGFVVIAGHRRLYAAQMLELSHVPCFVMPGPDHDLQIIENDQRHAVSPVAEAERFAQFRAEGASVADIASRIGRTPLHVARRLRLLALAPALLNSLRSGAGGLPVDWYEEAAKLGERQQNDLLALARGPYGPRNGAQVRAWIAQQGILLSTAPWRPGDVWDLACNRPCAGCPMNLGGGLFEDDATCMGRGCFAQKLADYRGLRTIGKTGADLRWADYTFDPLESGQAVVDVDSHPPRVLHVQPRTVGAEPAWKPQTYTCGGVRVTLTEKPSPEVLDALETLNTALEAKWSLMSG